MPVVSKMTVEGKGRPDSGSPHDLETDAVDKAEGASSGYEMSARGRIMHFSAYPDDAQNGPWISYKTPLTAASSTIRFSKRTPSSKASTPKSGSRRFSNRRKGNSKPYPTKRFRRVKYSGHISHIRILGG
jgi:hypothetical protein